MIGVVLVALVVDRGEEVVEPDEGESSKGILDAVKSLRTGVK